MGNTGHCTCGCGCLHGLRRADLQSSEEETRQKVVGSHRSSGICGCDSGGHSDRPDADAALTGQNVQSDEINSVWRRYDDRERKDAEADVLGYGLYAENTG